MSGTASRSWKLTFPLLLCVTAPPAVAQAIELDSGELLRGEVVEVVDNRMRFRLEDGSERSLDVRRVECERTAEGLVRRRAASLLETDRRGGGAALVAKLERGEDLAWPELFERTRTLDAQAFARLRDLTGDARDATRRGAVTALAVAATPESVRAALDAGFDTRDVEMQRTVLASLTCGAALAAVFEGDSVAIVEGALSSKDRVVRFHAAWIAARVGSAAALPVLASYVRDRDHHVRETAALVLAECGDASGAKLLITIASRQRSPAMAANRGADAATLDLVAQATLRERVRACTYLGELRHTPALPMLRRLCTADDPELARAAAAAIERLGRPADESDGPDGDPVRQRVRMPRAR